MSEQPTVSSKQRASLGKWLVPSLQATRKHYFLNGERTALCCNATRENARASRCFTRCSWCVKAQGGQTV